MSPTPPEDLRGATLYFDCASGIAGDMTVGALLDLGVPESVVRAELGKLPVGGYRIEVARVMRGGMAGCKFRVLIDEHGADVPGHAHGTQPSPGHAYHLDHGHAEHHADHHDAAVGHAHVGAERPDEQGQAHGHQPVRHHAHGHDHGGAHHHEHGGPHAHVHYASIRAMLTQAPLGEGVRRRALAMFDRVAVVEAKLHGMSVADVAFHEVGAVDSIVDIVGAAAALDWLAPARVVSRPVPLGHGTVLTAHGRLPVPAPATLELLLGAPVVDGDAEMELTTPTGAAILAEHVGGWGAMPAMTVLAVGWGAGDREMKDRPNLLRVVAGRELAAGKREQLLVIEANVDDMSAELAAPLVEALLQAGARDAWLSSVLMKKGRPGWVVSALCAEGERAAVEAALLRESTTIGLRRHTVERTELARKIVEVDTRWGKVPIKVAFDDVDARNAAPEFEACRKIAAEHGVPLKLVYAAALAAFYR